MNSRIIYEKDVIDLIASYSQYMGNWLLEDMINSVMSLRPAKPEENLQQQSCMSLRDLARMNDEHILNIHRQD